VAIVMGAEVSRLVSVSKVMEIGDAQEFLVRAQIIMSDAAVRASQGMPLSPTFCSELWAFLFRKKLSVDQFCYLPNGWCIHASFSKVCFVITFCFLFSCGSLFKPAQLKLAPCAIIIRLVDFFPSSWFL
jgi:hypothetical protein